MRSVPHTAWGTVHLWRSAGWKNDDDFCAFLFLASFCITIYYFYDLSTCKLLFFACFDRAIFLHFLPPPPPPPSPPPHSPRDEMGRPSLKQGLQYLVPVGSILRKSTEKRITVTKLRNFKTKSFPRPSDS